MYRSQLLFAALCFLAVFAEAKDKKKDKGDKKLKATSLDNDITTQTWPEPDDKVKDWLLDKDHVKFLDKWQKLADGEVKKLGAISKNNNFSAEGVCNKRYKCETIKFGSIANIDKDVKNPAKALKQISMKNMDKFLDHVKKRKPLKLSHHVQKDSLMAAEIHHAGVVARVTERNGTEVKSEHVAALAFDAYKYIIMKSEPTAIRAMGVQPEGKPDREISICLFPKGANRAQADNFCRGRDAEADEEDEKEAKKGKEKKKGGDDDDDSCSADSDKAEKGGQNKLLDMLKSMLGIKSDDKKDKSAKKCDPSTKEAKKSKKAKKEKKAGGKEAKKEEKGEKEEDKDKKKDAPFELEEVIIKVGAKKSDKGDSDKDDESAEKPDSTDESEDKAEKPDSKDEPADKAEKSGSKDKSEEKKGESKAAKTDAGKPKSEKKEKSATTKKLEKAVKKAEKAVKKAEKAAKKAAKKAANAVKKEDKPTTTSASEKDKPTSTSTKSESSSTSASTTTSAGEKAATKPAEKDAAKKDQDKKAEGEKASEDSDSEDKKDEKKLASRFAEPEAEPEAAYFGAESMDHLYGRSNEFQYGQYQQQYQQAPPRQLQRRAQLDALRRRQQILRARAHARRDLDYEDEEMMLRARFIREPRLRRDAMPEPEPEPMPEPEPEPEAEPEPEPEAEAEPEPAPEKQRGYLLSREFFEDVEHLLKRQGVEFNNDAQELFERGLGLDEAPEYYEW